MSKFCSKNVLQNYTSSDFTLKDIVILKSISSKKLIVKCILGTSDNIKS
jgi:hypothetical protein